MNRSGIKGLIALVVGLPLLFVILAKVLPDPDEEEKPSRPVRMELRVVAWDIQTGQQLKKALVQVGRIHRERFRMETEAEAGTLAASLKIRRALLTEKNTKLRISADGYKLSEQDLKTALAKWKTGGLPLRVALVPE